MTYHTNRDRLLGGAAPLERKDDNGGAALSPEIKAKFDEIMKAVTEMRTKNDAANIETKKGFEDVVRKEEIGKINAAVDELKNTINTEIAALKRPRVNGGEQKSAEAIEHSKAFQEWFRKGGERRAEVLQAAESKAIEAKALLASSDIDPAGGYTVTPEMETQIDQVLKEVSPMRALASVRSISSGSYDKLVNQHGVTSGWVGEQDTRPQTLAADLTKLSFPAMELYAMPAATQTLLDDSSINIDQWIADEVSLEFAQKEGAAFISGDGVNKPRGILSYTNVLNSSYAWGSVGYVKTGAAAAFAASNPADALSDAIFAIKAGYRQNASFLMNRATMGVIRKFKDGQGNYLVDLRLRDEGLVETIFGKTVNEAEDMPNLAANAFPVAYGDWNRAYLIVDRVGVRTLRDPYTAKPFVLFYTTKRVGGGVQNFEAFKLIKCEA